MDVKLLIKKEQKNIYYKKLKNFEHKSEKKKNINSFRKKK